MTSVNTHTQPNEHLQLLDAVAFALSVTMHTAPAIAAVLIIIIIIESSSSALRNVLFKSFARLHFDRDSVYHQLQ